MFPPAPMGAPPMGRIATDGKMLDPRTLQLSLATCQNRPTRWLW